MDDKPYLTATGQRSPRWAVWKRLKLVTRDGEVYLDRLRLIQTPYFGIYLHWIEGPDPDPDPHDHPWNFYSLVLRGGYEERVNTNPKNLMVATYYVWDQLSFHFMPAEGWAHRIVKVKPNTLTLVVVGRRKRDWGFWTIGRATKMGAVQRKWVSWQEYEQRPGSKQVTY